MRKKYLGIIVAFSLSVFSAGGLLLRVNENDIELSLGYSIDYVKKVEELIYSKQIKTKRVFRIVNSRDISYAYNLFNNVQPWGNYLYYLGDGWKIKTINHNEIDYTIVKGVPQSENKSLIKMNHVDYMLANGVPLDNILQKPYFLIDRSANETFTVVE